MSRVVRLGRFPRPARERTRSVLLAAGRRVVHSPRCDARCLAATTAVSAASSLASRWRWPPVAPRELPTATTAEPSRRPSAASPRLALRRTCPEPRPAPILDRAPAAQPSRVPPRTPLAKPCGRRPSLRATPRQVAAGDIAMSSLPCSIVDCASSKPRRGAGLRSAINVLSRCRALEDAQAQAERLTPLPFLTG